MPLRQAPTFTNILLPWALESGWVGVQYTDMDFRSRENSRVTSFLMSCLMTCRVQEGQGMRDRASNSFLLLTNHLAPRRHLLLSVAWCVYSSDPGI